MAIAGINIFASQHGGVLVPQPRAGAPRSSGPRAQWRWRCVPGDGASGGAKWFGQEMRVAPFDFEPGWA